MKAPETIESMSELREEIDMLDAKLVTLLADRARLIDRAAVLKQKAAWPARIDSRVEQVVENVRAEAARQGLDPVLAESLWRALIEWAIAREERVLGTGDSA
ncbi:MAG: chorismate mutase [Paracoccaceae bacterium]|jgi:isochorismate pyruvate lyase